MVCFMLVINEKVAWGFGSELLSGTVSNSVSHTPLARTWSRGFSVGFFATGCYWIELCRGGSPLDSLPPDWTWSWGVLHGVLLPLLQNRAWGFLHRVLFPLWFSTGFFCHVLGHGGGGFLHWNLFRLSFSTGFFAMLGVFSMGFLRHYFELDILALTARGLWGRGRGPWWMGGSEGRSDRVSKILGVRSCVWVRLTKDTSNNFFLSIT